MPMEFLAGSNYGAVTIGCNESLSAALLPKVIGRLGSQYPGITVHVVQLNRPINEEIGHLRQRSVDLILARGLFRVPEGDLESEVLFDESLVVVAGAHHPLVKRRKLSLAELVDAPGRVLRRDGSRRLEVAHRRATRAHRLELQKLRHRQAKECKRSGVNKVSARHPIAEMHSFISVKPKHSLPSGSRRISQHG